MADQKEIDSLIAMLDSHMAQGSGHINITVNDEKKTDPKEMITLSGETIVRKGKKAFKKVVVK